MIYSITSPKTIHEYNILKQSKREININTTSKNLDEYVYDKNGGLRNLGITAGFALADYLTYDMLKNDKAFKDAPKFFKILFAGVVLMFNAYAGNIIYNLEKVKQANLSNPEKKLELYRKHGINAVI